MARSCAAAGCWCGPAQAATSAAGSSSRKETTKPGRWRKGEAPGGDAWLHEMKFDGYRMICRIDRGQATLVTRNHKDWTKRLSALAKAAGRLPIKQAILDGEVVAMRPDGTTDFQDLQNAFREHRADDLYYYAFDLLYLDGYDLRKAPLEERKRLLQKLLTGHGVSSIRYSEHIDGNGPAFLKQACDKGLEGIISKRRDQPYTAGRGYDWIKVKCVQKDEFVIGGYTDPAGARTGFGALLVGYHDNGKLVYAGKVGAGYDDKTLRTLPERLQTLEQEESPFSNRARAGRGTHWLKPTLVAQVAFGGWTRDGRLRHASFQGLREDKPAAEVQRDRSVSLEKMPAAETGRSRRRGSPKPQSAEANYNASKQEFDGVRLTSPDKMLYPEQGITKLDLADYYRTVAEWMLPHVADRPLALVRCPEGRENHCFFQKHPPKGTPEALRQISVQESKTVKYVVVDDVAGLISLAQIGALEVHAWGSRADKVEQPDRLVFDMDPDPNLPWADVVQRARQVREFLQELGLECFVKTTGGKGLHLVVPIDRRHHWDEAKAFGKQVADLIVAADPQHYTANMSKAARTGKVFVDYLRNSRGATAIVAYSTRARPNAPVSTPLSWEELGPRITPDYYTIRNLPRRLAALKRDPWDGIDSLRQGLAEAMKKLESLRRH